MFEQGEDKVTVMIKLGGAADERHDTVGTR
jgi:hypothetical protein